MSQKNKLTCAVQQSLIFGAVSTVALSSQAIAFEDESKIERIEVTGSRINRTDVETASPVTVISAEYIAQSGYQSVEEILSTQPAVSGMSLGASSNNG